MAVGDSPPTDAARRARFLNELEAPDVGARARAFTQLATWHGRTAVRTVIEGVERVRKRRQRILASLRRAVARYERARAKAWAASERFTSARGRGVAPSLLHTRARALSQANALSRAAFERVRVQRADFVCTRTQLTSAAAVLGQVLRQTAPAGRPAALGALREAWGPSRDPEVWLVVTDALVRSALPGAVGMLRATLHDADRPVRRRALALDGLVAIDADDVLPEALRELKTPWATNWHLAAAAIQALRILREKAGIGALIAFLERKGLGRLRKDARAALCSLTGQRHGPYAGPWRAWWNDVHEDFVVPPAPPPEEDAEHDASPTGFYGIPTFSDRIAYVFDLSGSMWTRDEGHGPRIDTALNELRQAIQTLDPGKRFLLVPFGTRASSWRSHTVPATEANKRALVRWSRKVTQRGQTNAYDALDLAMAAARAQEGRPEIDTLFFLTDGVPTTGPLDDVAALLTEVAVWVRVERVRIHAVGIGEHDPVLLSGLAHLGGGRYVTRRTAR